MVCIHGNGPPSLRTSNFRKQERERKRGWARHTGLWPCVHFGYPTPVIYKTMHECNKDFMFEINLGKEWEEKRRQWCRTPKHFSGMFFLYGISNKLQKKLVTVKVNFFTNELSIHLVFTYENILLFYIFMVNTEIHKT
jgi:hypothetical protein